MNNAQWFLAGLSCLGFAVAWRAAGLAIAAREETEALTKRVECLEDESKRRAVRIAGTRVQ